MSNNKRPSPYFCGRKLDGPMFTNPTNMFMTTITIPQKQATDYTQSTYSLVSGDPIGGEIVVHKPSHSISKPWQICRKNWYFQSFFSACSDAFQCAFSARSDAEQILSATISLRASRKAQPCRVLPVCLLSRTRLAPVSSEYACRMRTHDAGSFARKNAGTFRSGINFVSHYACQKGGDL